MENERLARQVALVSYGSSYLRRQLPLEDFYRHGVFHGHRLLFRAPAGGALLADDFTLWLSQLQADAARRLSLHHSAAFALHAHGDLVIAVHFDTHYQLWAVGNEAASWRPPDAQDDCPSAAYYGGEIDTYWCVQQVAGQLDVPGSDWPAFQQALEHDLQLALQPGPARPFLNNNGDVPDWSNLPLFPYAPERALPHQLLAMLTSASYGFANDSHPKNDSSSFHHLSASEQNARYRWSERLAVQLTELQLRCANDDGSGSAAPPPAGLVGPAPAGAELPPADLPGASDSQPGVVGFVLLLIVLSLLFVAAAKLLAAYPWGALIPAALLTIILRMRSGGND